MAVVLSLAMKVTRDGDLWKISAPWLVAPVYAESFEAAYNAARVLARLRT